MAGGNSGLMEILIGRDSGLMLESCGVEVLAVVSGPCVGHVSVRV